MLLVDKFQRPLGDLRISVIDRCNFRCPYCMPDEQFHHAYQFLQKEEWLSFQEIERLVKIFIRLGVAKIRLTGGEPLLRPDVDVLISQLSILEGVDDLALTTNGSLLSRYAEKLKKAGLRRLTVSLDSLNPKIFKTLNGFKGELDKVLEGIQAASKAGFSAIKINAVMMRGVNEDCIMDLTRFARNHGHSLRFIEYMDVGNQNHWDLTQVMPSAEIIEKINAGYPLENIGNTQDGTTSEKWRFKDGAGEIGFISSVSHPFCGSCRRLRLSADGKIYTCLFATQGTDLREALRAAKADAFLESHIRNLWQNRTDQYSQNRSQQFKTPSLMRKVEMYQIGG